MSTETVQSDENSDPDAYLAYATPQDLHLIRRALLSAATQAQTDLPCQTHSERYGRNRVIDLLSDIADRRLALAKEREAEQPDTLGAWLYQRFSVYSHSAHWEGLHDEDKAYWEHHANAVRRAVERGGFKNPE